MTQNEQKPKVIEFRSEHSPTVLYACSVCSMVRGKDDRDQAERCCVCARCGGPSDRRHYVICSACQQAELEERDAARRVREMEKPVLPIHDGPVLVADSGRFYDDVDAAAEALYDDGDDPTAALVHPCDVVTLAVPDLTTWVHETWSETYEEGLDELPEAAKEALAECEAALHACAPTAWQPRLAVRVVLPAVEVTPSARRP